MTAPPRTRPPTTTNGRHGTRCISPRCSTGSSRTCVASLATTSSTLPPSNHSAASPRTSTSPCAAPSPGAELRQVLAATYHQVWWPPTTAAKYHDGELPIWHEASGNYLDPATGELLPTWDQALDAIGDDDEPSHVARFGERFDAQGVLAGSRDANRCIGYLTKYLTKHLGDCHQAHDGAQAAHATAWSRR
jgi:hypothetical protein